MRYWEDLKVGETAELGSCAITEAEIKWIRPVRPGDVLSVESEIREKIGSRSRPDRGTVKIESRVSNQRGEVVMSLVSLVIYLRR